MRDEFRPRREFMLLSIAFALFLIELIFENNLHRILWGAGEYSVSCAAYFLAGWNVLKGAFDTIRKKRFFDENVLMTIATAGAFAIHAISEAVGVMIFFKAGELLQNLAVARSRKSIRALLEIRPDYANLKTDSGVQKTSPAHVRPGQLIIVKAGEKIPLDGIIEEGMALINTAPLTGEPVPVNAKKGETVLAGEINIDGLLVVKVIKEFAESSIAKIIDLVENASAKKARTAQFITQFARYYTPAVVFLALAVALIPPLLVPEQAFGVWLYRALVLLVISCPCALVISIPLGYFGGIGGASRHGLLVKGANFIDILAAVRTVVFDKTGTLTKGLFRVGEVVAQKGYINEEILSLAATAEAHSNHPIAKSIIDAASHLPNSGFEEILEYRELPGFGVEARTETKSIIAGNDALLHRNGVAHDTCSVKKTVVHVAMNGKYAGYIAIGDELKEDSRIAIKLLRAEGVKTIGMLTGDNDSAAHAVADELRLDFYRAGLLPEDKVRLLESMVGGTKQRGKVAFVGDGINDSPVIARADVGMAMGGLGSDAAIETADVVLMTDQPSKVADAIAIGKKTRTIVWQNIILALMVKAVFVSFGAFGLVGMWEAVFADMGTSLLAIINALRVLHFPRNRPQNEHAVESKEAVCES